MEYRGRRYLAESKKVLVVVGEFNELITSKLLQGAMNAFDSHGIKKDDIDVVHVAGAIEVGQLVNIALSKEKNPYVGALALGCVIRGDTSHYDHVCSAVTQATMNASLKHNKPVSFGILTVDTLEQAFDRCGGKQGNKGAECATTLVEMIDLIEQIAGEKKDKDAEYY